MRFAQVKKLETLTFGMTASRGGNGVSGSQAFWDAGPVSWRRNGEHPRRAWIYHAVLNESLLRRFRHREDTHGVSLRGVGSIEMIETHPAVSRSHRRP